MDIDLQDHNVESDDTNGDGEGIWSPDIEQCFREALLLFPPCGRRKHILQEEGGGKMYGRNELIARHIMMRTGKKRTRKQVSSHIQVLARRKAKAEASPTNGSDSTPSPSVVVRSQSANIRNQDDQTYLMCQTGGYYDVWVDRPIVTQKIRLVEFSAFIEHRNFQPPPQPAIVKFETNGRGTAQLVDQTINHLATGASNIRTEPTRDLDMTSYPIHQTHQQVHPLAGATTTTTTHPLASNHHLPAQFNRASSGYQTNNNLQQHQPQQNQLHTHLQRSHISLGEMKSDIIVPGGQLQQPSPSSTGITRHSYVQINYSQPSSRQANKLERIDISQIQDKFPEIGGPTGLFQHGPADSFFLVKFWADLNNDYEYNIQDQNSYFGFSSHFETVDPYKDITCSTKACSYGQQVVEKVEKIYGAFNSSNGRYSYAINRSPMCEFMIQFIKKLRQLPRASQMNSVLENFTVLQVITSEYTSEILLCLAFVFEVALSTDQSNGPQYHVYKLTRDQERIMC